MLYTLLTMLPHRVSSKELGFHTQFVLRIYQEYYTVLTSTGLRDRNTLTKIKAQTAYSMSLLLWRRPRLWLKLRLFHWRLDALKKSVLTSDEVPQFSGVD